MPNTSFKKESLLLKKNTCLLNAGRNVILLNNASKIIREFKQKDVDFIVLKGLYLVFTVYPSISLRLMKDIDFLVKKKDLTRIDGILAGMGYDELSLKGQRRYGCDITFCHNDHKILVDIHWDLCQYERFKDIINITDDFWKRAVDFNLDGVSAKTLSVEDHILYIALHYALVHLLDGVNGAYDIFYLVKKFNPDWGKIIENASKYGIKMPLYYSLQKSQEISGLKLPDFVLKRLTPHPFKKEIIAYLFGRQKKLIFRILLQALMLDSLWGTARVLCRALKAAGRFKVQSV